MNQQLLASYSMGDPNFDAIYQDGTLTKKISCFYVPSMAVGINYYYGLVDVSADTDLKIKNSAIYFYVKIPIGVGKPKE